MLTVFSSYLFEKNYPIFWSGVDINSDAKKPLH